MIYDHLNSRFLSTEGLVRVVKQFIENDPGRYVTKHAQKRRKVTRTVRNVIDLRTDPESLWDTPWGRMIRNEEVTNPGSWLAKKFRRRFRIPYSLFVLLVKKCVDAGILLGQSEIAPKFKVFLVALCILKILWTRYGMFFTRSLISFWLQRPRRLIDRQWYLTVMNRGWAEHASVV
jgi:hypothetical protein